MMVERLKLEEKILRHSINGGKCLKAEEKT